VSKAAAVYCTFDKRETRLGNIEVIPTPGHTPGSVCFLVGSIDGKTYLFTGDTLFLNKGGWGTRVNTDGSRSDLKNSLMLLRDLKPTVVFSSASVGSVSFKVVSAEEWLSDVDKAIGALS
jgi:glyoxylase-like metal-dependent hydrolase (beta-lactamase superfamily II)